MCCEIGKYLKSDGSACADSCEEFGEEEDADNSDQCKAKGWIMCMVANREICDSPQADACEKCEGDKYQSIDGRVC